MAHVIGGPSLRAAIARRGTALPLSARWCLAIIMLVEVKGPWALSSGVKMLTTAVDRAGGGSQASC